MRPRVLDLFTGIGAYALGYSRAGWTPAAFCENNKKCHPVLRAQFGGVPIYDDVETLTGERLRADGVDAQWIVAGWPCQDISVAGSGLGLDGSRSGLWPHIPRLAREVGAEGLLLENSSNLLTLDGGRHFERVLGDLAALGFDAEWHCLPAAAFDAPHIRDRLWIVATHANADRAGRARSGSTQPARRVGGSLPAWRGALDADVARDGRNARRPSVAAKVARGRQSDQAHVDAALPYSDGARSHASAHGGIHRGKEGAGPRHGELERRAGASAWGVALAGFERHAWEPEPDVVRVVHGAPARVDRIHGLGNCNPPIVPEMIARAINEALL